MEENSVEIGTGQIIVKKILLLLAGGLIFVFGALGIIDLATNKLDENITNSTTQNTTVESFDTTN